jgi:ribosomal protein S20
MTIKIKRMANTLSARKNIRKSQKRQRHNRAVLKTLKKQIKGFLGKPHAEKLRTLQKFIDKATGKGLLPRNKGRRLQSRLSRRLRSSK